MKFDKKKSCFVNDGGSAIKPYTSLCTRFGNISDSTMSKQQAKRYKAWCVKELSSVPGGMDGLYQTGDSYRSEHLDKELS